MLRSNAKPIVLVEGKGWTTFDADVLICLKEPRPIKFLYFYMGFQLVKVTRKAMLESESDDLRRAWEVKPRAGRTAVDLPLFNEYVFMSIVCAFTHMAQLSIHH